MGEILALALSISGVAAYALLLFLLPIWLIAKPFAFAGLAYSGFQSMEAFGRLDALSVSEVTQPPVTLVTFAVVLLGVFAASEVIQRGRTREHQPGA